MSVLKKSVSTSNSLANSLSFGKEVSQNFHYQIFLTPALGPRNRESKKVDMDLNTGSATFNEDLSLNATLFQDTKSKKFQEKKVIRYFKKLLQNNFSLQSTLTIVIVTPKGNKIAGACDFDVASYPNQGLSGTGILVS